MYIGADNILTFPHILREGEGLEDSRYRLQEYLITNTILTNTVSPKQPQELLTYKLDKTAGNCPPYEKQPYDTIDYFISHPT